MSKKVRLILASLRSLRARAQEEVVRSQGGLPPEKCLECAWTNQAVGKVFGIGACLDAIEELFPEG